MNPALIVHQLKVLAAQAEQTMNTCMHHAKLVPYFNGKMNTFQMLQGADWDSVRHTERESRAFAKAHADSPDGWLREHSEGAAAAATEVLALLVASAPDEKPDGPPGVVIRVSDLRRMKIE